MGLCACGPAPSGPGETLPAKIEFRYPAASILSLPELKARCRADLEQDPASAQPGPRFCVLIHPRGDGFEMIEAGGECATSSGSLPGFVALVYAPSGEMLQRLRDDLWRADEIAYGVALSNMAPSEIGFLTEGGDETAHRWASYLFTPAAQAFETAPRRWNASAAPPRAETVFAAPRFCVSASRAATLRVEIQE